MSWPKEFRSEMEAKAKEFKRAGESNSFTSGQIERECARRGVEFHDPVSETDKRATGPPLWVNECNVITARWMTHGLQLEAN